MNKAKTTNDNSSNEPRNSRMNQTLTVSAAYGRTFETENDIHAAWNSGQDFKILDVSSPYFGAYVNKDDAEMFRPEIARVIIRYGQNLASFAVIEMEAGGE